MGKDQTQSYEVELKFEVSDAQMRRLRGRRILRELGEGPAARSMLRSVYFDTPEHQLRSHGVSLRVRQKGDSWIQTAKIGKGILAGLSKPIEIEHTVDGPSLELEKLSGSTLPRPVSELLATSELVPVFQTVISRTTRQLRAPGGGKVEIAFDSGTVQAGNATSQVREVELELKSGTPSSLFGVAEILTGDEAVRFSEWSKAERGYRLSNGEIGTLPSPVGYDAPEFAPDSLAGDVFPAQLRACTRQVAHNWLVVLDTDLMEGPHQIRIGLRRLRSLLHGYRSISKSDLLHELETRARELATTTGELRDADVLLEEIVADAADAQDGTIEFSALQDLLAQRRETVRSDVREKLAGRAMMSLLLKLGEVIETPEMQFSRKKAARKRVSRIAGLALEMSWKRASKWGRNIEDLSIEDRHKMRKALKKLRYQVDAFASLYDAGEVKAFRKKLKALQDVFGYLNDVAMAQRLGTIVADTGSSDPQLHGAVGFVLGWHTARAEDAWHEARGNWKSLARRKPFWRR